MLKIITFFINLVFIAKFIFLNFLTWTKLAIIKESSDRQIFKNSAILFFYEQESIAAISQRLFTLCFLRNDCSNNFERKKINCCIQTVTQENSSYNKKNIVKSLTKNGTIQIAHIHSPSDARVIILTTVSLL